MVSFVSSKKKKIRLRLSVLSLLEGARYCRIGKGESVIISAPLL